MSYQCKNPNTNISKAESDNANSDLSYSSLIKQIKEAQKQTEKAISNIREARAYVEGRDNKILTNI